MIADRWPQMSRFYHAALARDAGERAALLAGEAWVRLSAAAQGAVGAQAAANQFLNRSNRDGGFVRGMSR